MKTLIILLVFFSKVTNMEEKLLNHGDSEDLSTTNKSNEINHQSSDTSQTLYQLEENPSKIKKCYLTFANFYNMLVDEPSSAYITEQEARRGCRKVFLIFTLFIGAFSGICFLQYMASKLL
jgi:hypothetical protein